MHWLLLLLAIGSEIVATSALKETQGFTRLLPSLLCIGGYALAFYLLSVVVTGKQLMPAVASCT